MNRFDMICIDLSCLGKQNLFFVAPNATRIFQLFFKNIYSLFRFSHYYGKDGFYVLSWRCGKPFNFWCSHTMYYFEARSMVHSDVKIKDTFCIVGCQLFVQFKLHTREFVFSSKEERRDIILFTCWCLIDTERRRVLLLFLSAKQQQQQLAILPYIAFA